MKKPQYLEDIINICKYNHLSPEDIYLKLKEKYPNIWIATVYRSINCLLKEWKLRKIVSLNWKIYYETFIHPHFHIIDEETWKIIDISEDSIQISPELKNKIKYIKNINIIWKLKE